ncbi:MAG: SGNH/GDSL hydrolase family protein [Clostridia bacterium]|nr:SGNH/GDSL hydrolase family protein [Clostridia bacterium]
MNLNLSQIRSITLGAARVTEKEDGFHFYRFTADQDVAYTKDGVLTINTLTSAGVKFSFETESKTLGLKFNVTPRGTRHYFSIDVFVNGKMVDDVHNFEEAVLPKKYTQHPLPTGDFSAEFDLGEGKKQVCVHLPWNMETVIQEMSLDDGASITPIRPAKKLLCFGDSISQGYDALHPSRRYTAQLAVIFGMEEYNKAIGGEKFFPLLATLPDDFTPDLITVAYGTNDWRHRDTETLEKTCREFYTNLRKTYPKSHIVAIAPLWRKICDREYDCGPFRELPKLFARAIEGIESITLVDAYDFIPPYSDYFADLTLHPNGAGYDRYTEGLVPVLKDLQKKGIF